MAFHPQTVANPVMEIRPVIRLSNDSAGSLVNQPCRDTWTGDVTSGGIGFSYDFCYLFKFRGNLTNGKSARQV